MARSISAGNFLTLAAAPISAAPCTIACWFNPTSAATAGVLATVDDGTTGNEAFTIRKQATGLLSAQVMAGGASSVANTSASYSAGSWQHACAVFASATDRRVFLNGGSKGTNATSRTPGTLGKTNIGQTSAAGVQYAGDAAEVAIWNVALADGEVALLAAGRSPTVVQPAALVAYWRIPGNASPEPPTVGANSLSLSGSPGKAGSDPTVDNPMSLAVAALSSVSNAGAALSATTTIAAVSSFSASLDAIAAVVASAPVVGGRRIIMPDGQIRRARDDREFRALISQALSTIPEEEAQPEELPKRGPKPMLAKPVIRAVADSLKARTDAEIAWRDVLEEARRVRDQSDEEALITILAALA